ncbi:MAG: STAS domain-containing protein [Acidobacteria bacterium]|nr:STAS domain-containing protein [Acidobacteriota bacterium]
MPSINSVALTSFTVRGGSSAVGASIIEVSGPLTATAVAGFRVLLRQFVGDPCVTIDLSRCTEIDGPGTDALASIVSRVRAAGGVAAVVGETGAVELVLRTSGVLEAIRRPALPGMLPMPTSASIVG